MRRFVLLLIDLALIAMATVLALALRENLVLSFDRLRELLPYLGGTLAAATVILLAFRLNRGIWRLSGMSDYLRVVAAAAAIVLCAVGLGFANNRLEGVARSLPVIQLILIVAALVGVRVLMRLWHNAHRSPTAVASRDAGSARTPDETVLVVGINSITELFLRSVAEFAASRVQVAGVLGHTARHTGRLLQQHAVLGTPEQIDFVLENLEVHGIFVDRIVVTTAFDKLSSRAQEALLKVERSSDIRVDFFAERIGLDTRLSAPTEAMTTEAPAIIRGSPLSFAALDPQAPPRRAYWQAKRWLDVIGAVCLIVALAPLMALIALLVAIEVGLPVIFWQQRPGVSGQPFKLFKFRTMAAAHDRQGNRIPDEKRQSATRRFLRRTRLDELPQLYNILVGEMSFIGPRPLLPVDQCKEHNLRLLVRPGLTGWAQVNGGRDISPEAKSALDVWYVRNATLLLDLKIVGQTFGMLIRGERPDETSIEQAYLELGLEGGPGGQVRGSQFGEGGRAQQSGARRAVA